MEGPRGACDARPSKVVGSAALVLSGVVFSLLLALAVATASWERDSMRVEVARLAAEVAAFRGEREELHSRILHLTTEMSSVRAGLAQQEVSVRVPIVQRQERPSSSAEADLNAMTVSAESAGEFASGLPGLLPPKRSQMQPLASQIVDDSHARRLEILGTVLLSGSALAHSGCIQYTETGTQSIDMANPTGTCNGNRCPTCFVLNPASALALTVSNCGTSYVTNNAQMSDANTDRESSLIKFIFINAQSTNTVTDGGGGTVTLAAGETYKAWCMSNGLNTGISGTAHKLYWEKDPS